jgi:hypothetical protein
MIPQESDQCKSDFLKFHEKALSYLEKSLDFTENNLLSLLKNLNRQSELSFKHLKETVKALNPESDISLDQLYEEFCLSCDRINTTKVDYTAGETLDIKW